MNKTFGVIPEYVSHTRNYDYEMVCGASGTSFPEEYEIPRENTGTLKNQGAVGACVAETIAQIAESFYEEEMSEGFTYGTFREPSTTGSGLIVSRAMDFWKSIGTLPKKYFDLLGEMPEMRQITNKFPDLHEIASRYKLKGYASIGYADQEKRDNAIKDALTKYKRGLVAVSHEYFGGGHCIVLTGWNDNTNKYKIKNSWGKTYGDNGFAEIPKSAINAVYVPIFEDIVLPFTDVKETDWFFDDVKAMYFAGLSKGTSDNTYEPNRPITRAEDDVKTLRLLKYIDERLDILNRVISEKIK